ncbi:MAG: anhydro-N-acetylmuramic acid kinase [Paracoccaceae bacterium]
MKRLRDKRAVVQALGAMSGTSLDGVDAAVIETDGVDIHSFGRSDYRSYSPEDRQVLHDALGAWRGPSVDRALDVVQRVHLDVLSGFDEAEIIGFHGQTLAHAPREKRTLQIGDGQALADALNRPVVSDFRSADVKLGGEGAPLAPFFHFACARWIKASAPIAFLNLGGVGNLTWIDPSVHAPEAPGALLAFDTGPANAPINDLVKSRLGLDFDADGKIAASGTVAQGALETFLAETYFSRVPPKSLDRNDFGDIYREVAMLNNADAAATLTAMCAASVAHGLQHCPSSPEQVLVTGGGRHNPVLMQMLDVSLDCPVHPIEKVGLDGDMLEAQAFAYLAVRVARGLPTSCPSTTGVSAAVGGGTISVPNLARSNV